MSYNKIEQFDEKTLESLSAHYKNILTDLGEDTSREGLEKTPHRVAKANLFLTQGYKMNAVEIINCCDVFLVSSREDPFPLVVLEAALCGKPILGFKNTGGVDEFIDDSCGIKVDYLNVFEMSKQITTLNSQNIKNLGEKSRDKVLRKYNFEVSIKKIESIFKEMV